MKKLIFLISGPSGSGKNTLITKIKKDSELEKVIGYQLKKVCSTRSKPLRNDENPDEYKFLPHDEFKKGVINGEFVDYKFYSANNSFYGVKFDDLKEETNTKPGTILELDNNAANRFQNWVKDYNLSPQELTEYKEIRISRVFVSAPNYKESCDRFLSRKIFDEKEFTIRFSDIKSDLFSFFVDKDKYDYYIPLIEPEKSLIFAKSIIIYKHYLEGYITKNAFKPWKKYFKTLHSNLKNIELDKFFKNSNEDNNG